MSDEKLTVLVADDSRVIRKAFSRIMSEHYELIEAENGQDAWAQIEIEHEIAAVFTDWEMPLMDGLELTKQIRESKNPRIKTLPIIMVTSKNDDEETMKLAFDAGVNDFVAKPFDTTVLQARAKSHVKKRDLKGFEESQNAVMDSVSRLGNMQYFQEQGNKLAALASRHNLPLGVALIGIDQLPELAKKYGAGEAQYEEFVATVGAFISDVVRKEDSIARVGKGMFGVLLASADLRVAYKFAERVQSELKKETFTLNGEQTKVSISVGLSMSPAGASKPLNTLIKEARERLLLASKEGGKIRPEFRAQKPPSPTEKMKLDSLDKALGLISTKQAKNLDTNYLAKRLLPMLVHFDKSHGTQLAKNLLPVIKGK